MKNNGKAVERTPAERTVVAHTEGVTYIVPRRSLADELEASAEYTVQSAYPYCEIPPYFFERTAMRTETESHSRQRRESSLFTVERWDGTNVFSLKRSEAN